MRLWRLGSGLFPLWSGDGARLKGGRWNEKGTRAIYASASFAAAVLEVMVHANIGRVPRGTMGITIDIPDDVPVDRLRSEQLDLWDAHPPSASRAYGDAWLKRNGGLVLMVPSAVTSGWDDNAMINPLHPAFGRIVVSAPLPVRLDPRLFPG